METENNNQLPFLDVCVSKTNNSIRTGVYRKPTHTDQYIHLKSNHPNSVKSATISALVNRAKKICDPESLSKEIDHLKYVFTNFNGYPEKFVTNTIKKTLSASAAKPKPPTAPVRIFLPFNGKVSYQIKRLLMQQPEIDVTFTKSYSTKDVLRANGKQNPTQPPQPKRCVYQIACNCGISYVGETKRALNKR
ncbi:hypothetical protein SNE40_014255 [Patella caerulea]|uniref:Helix-turn-helix domain-containing protein n=1 Tax=Patella caerulea TaxID=87958 RepID=A0AAN8JHN3_PATCE